MKLTFLFPLSGLVAGIYMSSEFFPGLMFPAVSLGLGLVYWLILHLLSRNPLTSYKISQYHPVWVILLFMALGSWDFEYNFRPKLDREIAGQEVIIKGRIKEVSGLAEGDRFKIDILRINDVKGTEIKCDNIGLLLKTDGFSARPGDIVIFKAKPTKFREDTKSYRRYACSMKRQGIYYSEFKTYSEILKIGNEKGLKDFSYSIQKNIIIAIEKSSLSKTTSQFIISILLGDKSYLPADTKNTLSSAGMAHILAVSGLHVGIIFSLFLFFFFPLNFFGKAHIGKILAILMVWGYVFLTGFAFSTVRAAIMATFILAAWLLQRKHSSLNALLGAAFIILILNPSGLWDIGFQLSFIAVLSILLFIDKFNPVQRHNHPYLYNFINVILLTIISTLCTWVLIAFYYKNIPVQFLPANILLIPMLPIFMGASILYVFLLLLGIDFNLLGKFINHFHDFFLSSAGFLSGNGSSTVNINIDEFSVVFWLCAIIIAAFALHSQKKLFKKVFYSLSVLFIIISVGQIIFKESQEETILRFKHDFAFMVTGIDRENLQQELKFPNGNISSSKIDDTEIWAVDCILNEESLMKKINENKLKRKFLIVGPRSDFNQIASLIESGGFEKIILHANISHNQIDDLMEMLNEKEKEKIHSLRLNGSLEVLL